MDIIILYILIMSVSFFCAGIFRKRFEEILPLSFIFIMLSLFIFGLLDQLKFGVYGNILLLSCLYIAIIYNCHASHGVVSDDKVHIKENHAYIATVFVLYVF